MKVSDLVPDVDVLLGMGPEELGGVIIEVLAESGPMTLAHIDMELFGHDPAYPTERRREVWLAIAEAWTWLEGQALLIWKDDMNGPNGWRVLSRRGRKIAGRNGMEAYRRASLLPKEILDSRIVNQALVDF